MQNSGLYVAKFGGTSVASYSAMMRCAEIIADHPTVKVVVVSAPAGLTNLLIKLNDNRSHLPLTKVIFEEISAKITDFLSYLPSNSIHIQEINKLLITIEKLVKQHQGNAHQRDELISMGERISAQLFTAVLKVKGIDAVHQDARSLIKTDTHFGKANVLLDLTKQQVNQLLMPLCQKNIVVTEGFIGSTLENVTTTLGRGGSDYSAALLAEALNADALQIWTDVTGIYTVDPNLVSAAKQIQSMCFTEASELANFGAKVLHPATLWPAIRKNIPVFVGSSIDARASGTWIRAELPTQNNDGLPLLSAIALRKKQTLLTIHSLEMLQTHGFLAKVFAILAQHKLSVDLVTTSEVSVALTLDNSVQDSEEELLTDVILQELQGIGNISLTIDKNLSLVALIGHHLHLTPGVSGRVFNTLTPFNIRLICHGASQHNICFLVHENDAKDVVKKIHAEFFEK